MATARSACGIPVTWIRKDGSPVPGLAYGHEGAPGVIVVQEWWGVDEEVKEHAIKIAEQGYRALVPDLYRGKIGVDAEEAHHLMTNLDFPGALEDIRGAALLLRSQGSTKVGVIGFCMGGALALASAVRLPAEIDCAAPFYGIPPLALADPAALAKPLQAHFGGLDAMQGFSAPADVAKLQVALAASAVPSEVFSYPSVGHAFMNATPAGIARRLKLGQGGHDQAAVDLTWSRVFSFFAAHLKA